MNKTNVFVIGPEELRKFDEAYIYGTYVPMNWLKDELIKIKLKIISDSCVSINGVDTRSEIESINDFKKWVEGRYPDLLWFIE